MSRAPHAPIKTVDDLRAWLRANVPPPVSEDPPYKPLKSWTTQALDKKMCWWLAYRSAQGLLEDTTRHLAHTILKGGLGPITLDSVREDLELRYEDDDPDWVTTALIEDLCEFFNVSEPRS